jgi:hypothetical protein
MKLESTNKRPVNIVANPKRIKNNFIEVNVPQIIVFAVIAITVIAILKDKKIGCN